MDAIRAALGDSKLTYIGFSYGTYLATQYALRFPANVRALVLDGAVDPSIPAAESTRLQAVAFERSLNAFLAECSRRTSCAFVNRNDARTPLSELLKRIEAQSITTRLHGESRRLGPTEIRLGIAAALYSGVDGWPTLAAALDAARRGDGAPMLRFFDSYTGRETRGVYSNEQAAFFAIACADGQLIAAESELVATANALRDEAPFLGPDNAWLGSPCAYWPVHAHATAHAVSPPSGLPRLLVVSTTNDPATPYESGVSLARQLNASLLSVEGDAHTAYSPSNQCVTDVVDAYLVSAKPAANVKCGTETQRSSI